MMTSSLVRVAELLERVPKSSLVPSSEYQRDGLLPVVDQGDGLIGGYTDRHDARFPADRPVVIFGDHTCRLKYVDFPFARGAQGTQVLLPIEGVNPRFLYYALHTVDVSQFGYQRHFKYLKDAQVRVPALATQHRIAAALGAFDDLIQNNRRRIEILREVARLLYCEWFVHFRFPGREDVELVDSELGPIPKAWEVQSLDKVAEVRRGLSWDRDQEAEDGVGVLTIPNVGSEFDPVPRKFLRGVTARDLQRFAAEAGDTLMIGSNGNPERVGQSVWVSASQNCVVASFLMRIRSFSDLDPYLVYHHVSGGRMIEGLRSGAVGSTGLRNLRVTAVRHAPLLRAPREVEETFVTTTKPMRALQDALLVQNRVVAEVRDLLLPPLISGGLDVSALELDVEPVA